MTFETPKTILHAFSTFRVGGPQIRFCMLANFFGATYRHVIFAMDGCYDCHDRLASGIDVTIADVLAKKRDTLGNRRRFRSYLKANRPNLLITYNWGSVEWAMANWPLLLPHLHIEDGFGPEEADRQLFRRGLMRRLVLSKSQIVVPSRTLERIALDIWRLDARRVRYVPNGIDCARFSAQGIVPFDWPGSEPVIGTVAALRPEKNLTRLLDAFRLVRTRAPCRLLIAGDGPERQRLEAYAESLNLRQHVKFAGHADAPERIYEALDVFALSSDTEQMPTTVIEAMAAGLPVVATNVGDISQIVSNENLPFIVGRNEASLAEAILNLQGDPEMRARIGAANRKVAESRFEERTMAAAYAALFD